MSQTVPEVDQLLQRLRDGDPDAPTELFNRFARRLIGLARTRLDARLRQKIDPEDVVQSVFRSFFTRNEEDRFDIRSEDRLWSLLAVITVRKCTNVALHFGRQGRDVRLELGQPSSPDESHPGWEGLARDPAPDEAVLLAEVLEHAMAGLSDRDEVIITAHLQGASIDEIAEQIGRSERTVQRAVETFRTGLERALDGT